MKPIPHKLPPHILLTIILNLIILPPGPLNQPQKMQPRPRVNRRRGLRIPILEPRTTGPRPGRAFEERVRMAEERIDDAFLGADTAEALDLHFFDHLEEVGRPALDQGEEGAVRGGAVGAGELEIVGDFGEGEAQVGGRVGEVLPFVAHVLAVDKEGEAGLVAGVKAGRADDDVDFDFVAVGVEEAFGGYLCQLGAVDGNLLGAEGFEIAVAGCGSSAADEEVCGHDLLDEIGSVFQ